MEEKPKIGCLLLIFATALFACIATIHLVNYYFKD